MNLNLLATLLRSNQLSLEAAKQALATALREEDQAKLVAEAAEAAIRAESDLAESADEGDATVEAFMAWLPIGRARLQAARNFLEQRTADVVVARSAVTLAHAAAEATASLQARQMAEIEAKAAKKAQGALDETAARIAQARAAGG